jgi:hypothetical protein
VISIRSVESFLDSARSAFFFASAGAPSTVARAGWIFKITWGPSNSLLGTGERACWHCKTLFWDGSQEWPETSGDDQRLFLLPITVVGFVRAFILILALTQWISFFLRMPARFRYDLFFMVFGIPMLLWFAIRGWQVNRSIHLYNDRVKR